MKMTIDDVTASMKRDASVGNGFMIQIYSTMYIVIDGSLMTEEQSVDVRIGPSKTRVLMRCAVPSKGIEWDGREAVGTDREFSILVIGPKGEPVLARNMKCIWFAVSHSVNDAARARAVFECSTDNAQVVAE
jgi:hypothetical protein